MPAIGFKCPNGDTVSFKQCFAGCDHQCMALPARLSAGDTRPWRGKPSVTQLIKPTLPAYLEIVNDYYIDPMSVTASMIGTNSHKAFEEHQPNGWLAEVRLEDDITSGQFDAYDCKNKILYDWKFFGVFRIAKALGYHSVWKKYIPTRGKNKGTEQWKQEFIPGGVRDVREIAIQLSYYKYLMEKHNLQVDKILVNMFVRGGLDKTAKSYGIEQQAYLIPIHPISAHWVRMYMKKKYDMLMTALETNTLPPICSKRDRWDTSKTYPDRKCRDWCSVNQFCPYYQENYGGEQHGQDS